MIWAQKCQPDDGPRPLGTGALSAAARWRPACPPARGRRGAAFCSLNTMGPRTEEVTDPRASEILNCARKVEYSILPNVNKKDPDWVRQNSKGRAGQTFKQHGAHHLVDFCISRLCVHSRCMLLFQLTESERFVFLQG